MPRRATMVHRMWTAALVAAIAAPAAVAASEPIVDPQAIPAGTVSDPSWSLTPIMAASIDDVSRALWWRDTIGVVFGTEADDHDGVGATLGAVHVGGAWRAPLDHDLGVMLRGEVLGEGTEPSGWRTGASCSLHLAPNADLEASAWWSVPGTGDAESAAMGMANEPVGSAWLGLSLRF
jgi:hypothetical protein